MKISHSQLQCFKQCRRLYQLSYVEGLRSIYKAEPLVRGIAYHDYVDEIHKAGLLPPMPLDGGLKPWIMAKAYYTHIYKSHKYFNSMEEFKETEVWFNYAIPKTLHEIVGRLDGIKNLDVYDDGVKILLEHKTYSSTIGEDYLYQLQFDEQVLMYMMVTGARYMYYTVCRPPTIRQHKNESDVDYVYRCEQWYAKDTSQKITVTFISRTNEEIEDFQAELIRTLDDIEFCNLFYRNTSHCQKWGRFCEYASICMNYSPDTQYVGFERTGKK